jgi:excisionase family DNA binding protein
MGEPKQFSLFSENFQAEIRAIIQEAVQAAMNDHKAEDRLISSETAAERWEVPKTWIEEKARRGELPCVKLGHYLRFRTIDLERFIKEHRK